MSLSLEYKGLLIGCVIGFTLTARLAIALAAAILGPVGGLADVADELSIVIALLAACRLKDRFKNHCDNIVRRRVLEEGFVKWTAELEARKAALAAPSAPPLRKVA